MQDLLLAVDAPHATEVLNLIVAFLVAIAAVLGTLWKLRKWQKADMAATVRSEIAPVLAKQASDQNELMTQIVKREIAPVIAQQGSILQEQEELKVAFKQLADKVDRTNSTVAGHESRLSFLEGKEAARAEFRGVTPPVELTDAEGGVT